MSREAEESRSDNNKTGTNIKELTNLIRIKQTSRQSWIKINEELQIDKPNKFQKLIWDIKTKESERFASLKKFND